tara:strand:- start:124527 stop:127052 length:2526 start_codon:yes stop_codon:yes gene_type:complete
MQLSDSMDDDIYATVDILASDFVARYRNGERPTVDEYASRHPELSESIRRVFPLVLSVEKVKIDQQSERDGSATLAGRVFEKLGDFRLVREIGRGGMGIVYEAEQQSLGRRVAIKVLPKQSLLDDDALRSFSREASTAAAMHHPNIVPIFGAGQCDGTHYLVMQLIRGESLDKRIATEGSSFDCRTAAEIGAQISDGLAYAHGCGVLHRDVKPANILIDENGIAQLTDFGLARNPQDDPTVTQVLSGSPRYMAPERFQGRSDERCDVYGLGLTIYEMLAGSPAFSESDSHQLMEAVTRHRVKPLKDVRPDTAIDLQTIVSKAINPDPAHRYHAASELRDDLKRFLADEPILARRITILQRQVRWCRRNPALAGAIGLALISMLAATIASSIGIVMTSTANKRTTEALAQSEHTVDLALLSLDRVVDVVSMPASAYGDMGEVDSAAFVLNPSPHAAKVLENIQPLYARLADQSPTRPDIVWQMAEASLRLSRIQLQLGQSDASIATLDRSINLLQTRSDIAGLPRDENRLLLARVYNDLGKVYALELEYEQSEEAFKKAIATVDEVSAPDDRHRLQLAYANISLGDPRTRRRRDTASPLGESQIARERLSAAEKILNQLAPMERDASEAAVLRSRIHLAQSRRAKRPMARQLKFASAIAILRKQLERSPDDSRVRFALVETLAGINLRRQANSGKTVGEASERLHEALSELQLLRTSYPETPLFAVSEVHVLHKLSSLSRSRGEDVLVLEQLNKAISIQSSLVDASPNSMPHRCWRALLYRSLADAHRRQRNLADARDAIAAAIADLDAIAPDSRSHPFAVQTQQTIANLHSENNREDDAYE